MEILRRGTIQISKPGKKISVICHQRHDMGKRS
jgi:hypothetical protein